jgi:hypothetical protein
MNVVITGFLFLHLMAEMQFTAHHIGYDIHLIDDDKSDVLTHKIVGSKAIDGRSSSYFFL